MIYSTVLNFLLQIYQIDLNRFTITVNVHLLICAKPKTIILREACLRYVLPFKSPLFRPNGKVSPLLAKRPKKQEKRFDGLPMPMIRGCKTIGLRLRNVPFGRVKPMVLQDEKAPVNNPFYNKQLREPTRTGRMGKRFGHFRGRGRRKNRAADGKHFCSVRR